MTSSFEISLRNTLKRVVDAINRHEKRQAAPLSLQILIQVKKELEEMIEVMNPKVYQPSYPRFILDWPDEEGLIDELINASYLYGKIRVS